MMSSINVKLPISLHEQVQELAQRDNVSVDEFIRLAVAEKVSALMTVNYLQERAARGDRAKFERVLEKIAESGAAPLEEDRLPQNSKQTNDD
jgi:Arc/MetJ-type ribon-helix-helix transcriptional regulator